MTASQEYRKLSRPKNTPHGGFRWRDIEGNFEISYGFPDSDRSLRKVGSLSQLIGLAIEGRLLNGIPIPENFHAIVEDGLCQLLPSNQWYGGNPEIKTKVGPRKVSSEYQVNANDLIRGANTLTRWMLAGKPLVSFTEANERASICANCPMQVNTRGCSVCHKMLLTIEKNVPKGFSLDRNDSLYACGVCKCSNKVQVWVPDEYLAFGIDPTLQAKYEEVPNCWKKNIKERDESHG